MLSEKKLLLRIAELVAILATLVSLYLAVQTQRAPDADFPVFLWGTGGMAVMMLTFLPACMLCGEYVKTVKKPTTWRERSEGLNSTEISMLVRWSPGLYKAAAIGGILVAVISALRYGSVEFHSSEPVDVGKIPGMFLYMSALFLLALPILASAARMPGTYAAESDA